MASNSKQPVLLDKDLHRQLKLRLKSKSEADMTDVVSRLVEMYLKGEVKVTIPERQL